MESLIALGPEPVPVERNILYLVRPRMELMSQIAGHIHAHAQEASAQTCSYAVYFVPRRTLICERILEEEGVIGNILHSTCCISLGVSLPPLPPLSVCVF